jgi:hypothetical protein
VPTQWGGPHLGNVSQRVTSGGGVPSGAAHAGTLGDIGLRPFGESGEVQSSSRISIPYPHRRCSDRSLLLRQTGNSAGSHNLSLPRAALRHHRWMKTARRSGRVDAMRPRGRIREVLGAASRPKSLTWMSGGTTDWCSPRGSTDSTLAMRGRPDAATARRRRRWTRSTSGGRFLPHNRASLFRIGYASRIERCCAVHRSQGSNRTTCALLKRTSRLHPRNNR